jgi:CBS domain-containing protein
MTIASILAHKGSAVTTVTPDMAVHDVARLLTERRIGAALVTDTNGDVLGVISERDIVKGVAGIGAQVLQRPAREIMTSPVITCSPRDSVNEAMEQMTDRRIRHLPVLDGGKLAGMVSIGDLVKARIDETEREAAALKDYIAS